MVDSVGSCLVDLFFFFTLSCYIDGTECPLVVLTLGPMEHNLSNELLVPLSKRV